MQVDGEDNKNSSENNTAKKLGRSRLDQKRPHGKVLQDSSAAFAKGKTREKESRRKACKDRHR